MPQDHAPRSVRWQHGAALFAILAVSATAACTQGGELKAGFAPPPPDTAVTRLAIFPLSARITTQDSIQLTYYGLTSTGDTVPTTVADWEASGGTISPTGMFSSRSPGNYRVTAHGRGNGWGPGGRNQADTSTVTVTNPAPTLTAVSVSPSTVSLQPGEVQQFAATGLLSDGSTSPVTVTYSATGGSISSGGLYTAGTTLGTYRAIATEPTSGFADTAAITVTGAPPPALTAVVLTPATVSVQTGASQQFAASGRYSDGSTGTVSVSYSATGGSITSAGFYTAGGTAGTYRVIATEQGGSLADTSVVTVTAAPPTLTAVILTPAAATLQVGATRQFSVVGQYSDGSAGPVTVSYSATGGTITSGGLYTAGGAAGTFRVIATQQGGTLADTASVTLTPIPTLTAVVLSPTSVTLQSGATRQFSVIGQFSDGSTGSVAVTYSATGGTITSGGLYTAGATPGSFRVIATEQGGTLADTSTVTISSPPTLTQVVLSPPSATLQTGASQQFSVVGQYSDGSTGAVAVTYNATGGTISSGGLYTAGSTAGSFRVIAVQQGGTLADTSSVAVVAPPPPGASADPTLLPVASGQRPDYTQYATLGVASMVGGGSYADPVTGVRVWKVTSASVPQSNSGGGNDYAAGPIQVSRQWGGNKHTVLVRTAGAGYFLVDFTRGSGFTNWRRIASGAGPSMDLGWTFSANPATPQIAYSASGNRLVRYNTATNQIENTGFFPRDLSGNSSTNIFTWLQQDKNDVWFVLMGADKQKVVAWNSQTNALLVQQPAGMDEPRFERDGRYVVSVGGSNQVQQWDLTTNTLGNTFNAMPFAHNANLRGMWLAHNYNAAGAPEYRLAAGSLTATVVMNPALGFNMHQAGQWIQSDADLGGDLTKQWALASTYDDGNFDLKSYDGVAFVRADGSDVRLLAHHYSRPVAGVYWDQPHATLSPDGKVVLFESNMNRSGRSDLFLIEVPLQ